ncbi:MAG: hypothetical protein ACOVNU_05830 [Candidatus Kapaibacteriota bacterium]
MKKNIYLLPTIKPSRLAYLTKKGKEFYKDLRIFDRLMPVILDSENQNLFITSEEEIKEGDWGLTKLNVVILFGKNYTKELYKKVILTTDQDLINHGVQAIDEEFLNWYIKNLTCEEIEVTKWSSLAECGYSYHITIPKEKITDTEEIIIPKEELKHEYSVHLRHCYQGEYEDGCKYGEDDCPAKPLEEPKQFIECRCTNNLQLENCVRNCGYGEEPEPQTLNMNTHYVEFWHPTPILRWEKHYTCIDRVNYDKVLQQMWQSNTGKQEWRDVQEED